jgi:hypothetical protein
LLTAIAITGASPRNSWGEVPKTERWWKSRSANTAFLQCNPIGREQITGLARLLRGNAHAALENEQDERVISRIFVERSDIPGHIALDHAAPVYAHRERSARMRIYART